MSENRVTIECFKCGEEFTKLIPKEEQKGVHFVTCPFCGVESKIEFEVNRLVDIYRSRKR
ncbi:hypothetical protein GSY74_01610 [Sulfurovum sp. bin170]|uniref:hypothetical protein n=1 Tax=Sulfurovum sp. bin170 TaxID=2695268 RepID=UPI0013DFE029|nr:hypothetical protein [Sulfurovum sp. bin170]NEW59967.1 hypothetical protein [Sulfurovum sp. bin170]